MRRFAAALLLCACTGGHARTRTDAALPPPASPASPEPGEVPAGHACGEPGDRPTRLPDAVATGLMRIGSGTVRRGETGHFGGVTLQYDDSAWFGTMEVGHRGPGLVMLMPREEANGGGWGTLPAEVTPGATVRMSVGPYRLDAHVSNEAQPASVAVEVGRRGCPDQVRVPVPERPTWLWLSSEAIHDVLLMRPAGDFVRLGLQTSAAGPRFDLENGPHRHWLEPRPGERRTLRSGDLVVTIEEVVRGPENAAGTPAHARIRVERAAPPEPDTTRAAAVPCGAASPSPTAFPPELAATPRADAETTIALGESRRLGPLDVRYEPDELPGIGREPPTTRGGRGPRAGVEVANLIVKRGDQQWSGPLSFGMSGTGPRVLREGDRLLRMDALDDAAIPRLRLRTAPMRCPKTIEVPAPAAAEYLWVGTRGHGTVMMGPPMHPVVVLQVYDGAEPSLGLSSEHANLGGPLSPALVGRSFTLDAVRVDVVEVRQDTDAAADVLLPSAHVLLRVAPEM